MGNVFRSVLKMYNLAFGDFPDLPQFQSVAREQDFSKFPALRLPMIDAIDTVISVDIPRLMDALPRSLDPDRATTVVLPSTHLPPGPPLVSSMSSKSIPNVGPPPPPSAPEEEYFATVKAEPNPFEEAPVEVWGLQEYIPVYQASFDSCQQGGFVTGGAARTLLASSGLATKSLRAIWDLADYGKDGKLDLYEFVICMFLVDMLKAGHELPPALDPVMIPPTAAPK